MVFRSSRVWVGIALLHASLGAGAGIIHDEGVNGDLSDNPAAPTALGSLAAGENEVIGVTVRDASGVVDRDYFTFTIDGDSSLTTVTLIDWQAAGDNLGFIGLYGGSTASTPAGVNPTLSELLGGAHINLAAAGDIFPLIENLFGEDKFDRPLGPGDYTILIQQTGPQVSEYRIGFGVTSTVATPEPSTLAVLALGLVGAGYLRQRRRIELSGA